MGIDRQHLRVTGKHKAITDPHLLIEEDPKHDVTIVITQAFGPKGDNLVGITDTTFDGFPAVTIGIRAAGREGQVHLSPIHADDRKLGMTDIPDGTECELFCPVSGEPLDSVPDFSDDVGTHYYAIYLTPEHSQGAMVAISNVWGHYHSRIVDHFELISSWIGDEDE